MKETDNGSIEFELGSDADGSGDLDGERLNGQVRQWFRVPTKESDGISVHINGRQYDVINFSKIGIAIYLPQREEVLSIGAKVPSIELRLPSCTVNLQAKVDSLYYDEAENQVCGLSFIGLDNESQGQIDKFYWQLRDRLLSNE
jgi:hypothetical protein